MKRTPSILTSLFSVAIVFLAAATAAGAIPLLAADDPGGADLSVFGAIILGLVEGFTEYLPVSSTGHLLVASEILGISGDASDVYAICIQAGAILAVFFLYRQRLQQMADGLLGRSEEGKTVLKAVIVAFIPTAIIALSLYGTVRERLFGVAPIAAAWIVGGLAILALTRSGLLERGGIELHELTAKHAVLIGVAQTIALWPGVSRSLITIVAGVVVGLTLRAAVEFSFLLGLITLGAATAKATLDDGSLLLDTFGWQTPLIGLVVAFVAALVSVRWMVSWLQERSLDVFGYYRIAAGIVALIALQAGWITG